MPSEGKYRRPWKRGEINKGFPEEMTSLLIPEGQMRAIHIKGWKVSVPLEEGTVYSMA